MAFVFLGKSKFYLRIMVLSSGKFLALYGGLYIYDDEMLLAEEHPVEADSEGVDVCFVGIV